MDLITRTEEMLLLAVCRLQEEAFGLNIRQEVEAIMGKRYSVGGIYVPLDRLVGKGFLTTEAGRPTAERLGRPRRLNHNTACGLTVLR
jgi:PadR family transcriptional regulator PadR